jgi:hypothetical protein
MAQRFPVGNLAKYGLLADPDPYTLPPEAWSAAVNVRFRMIKFQKALYSATSLTSTAPSRAVVRSGERSVVRQFHR